MAHPPEFELGLAAWAADYGHRPHSEWCRRLDAVYDQATFDILLGLLSWRKKGAHAEVGGLALEDACRALCVPIRKRVARAVTERAVRQIWQSRHRSQRPFARAAALAGAAAAPVDTALAAAPAGVAAAAADTAAPAGEASAAAPSEERMMGMHAQQAREDCS